MCRSATHSGLGLETCYLESSLVRGEHHLQEKVLASLYSFRRDQRVAHEEGTWLSPSQAELALLPGNAMTRMENGLQLQRHELIERVGGSEEPRAAPFSKWRGRECG